MNKLIIIFLAFVCSATSLFAQTIITSDIATNTTWTAAGSPYLIQVGLTSFNIDSGATLTLDPGVEVQSENNGFPINVQGSLVALGTATDSVIIHGVGGDIWEGITGYGEDGSVLLEYTRYEDSYMAFDSITQLIIVHSVVKSENSYVNHCGIPFPNSPFASEVIIESAQFGDPSSVQDTFAVSFSENLQLRGSDIYCGGVIGAIDGVIEYCNFYQGGFESMQSMLIQFNIMEAPAQMEIGTNSDIKLLYNKFNSPLGGSLYIFGSLGLAPSIINQNEFCANIGQITFAQNPTDVLDLSENCWCTSDTVEIMGRFTSILGNPLLHEVILSPTDSLCSANLVFPGDANYNKLANVWDLLPIGVHFGTVGPVRPDASTNWTGQDAPGWTTPTTSNVNLKHVDCNGDGIIDGADVQAIVLNYNSTHLGQRPARINGGIPLYMEPLPNPMLPGDTLKFLVHLGSMDTLAQNIYGIAFAMAYDSSLIEPGSVSITFDSTWMGTDGTDLLTLGYDDFENGRIEIAEVRTDQMPVSGHGAIAEVIVILDDDISKKEIDLTFTFESVVAIDPLEADIPVSPQNAQTVVLTSLEDVRQEKAFKVFPNPASSTLSIQSDERPVGPIALYSLSGKLMLRNEQTEWNHSLQVKDLAAGVYILEVQAGDEKFREKILIRK